MNYLFVITFFFYSTIVNGQSFVKYKDTINHFSVDIPVGWRYGLPKNSPSIKLMAYRAPTSLTDTSKDNYNLNIIATPNLSLENTYMRFLAALESTDNFELLNFGDTIINGKKFKWLIETHRYENDQIQMHNYDFVTYYNDQTYILTFTTFSNRFVLVKPTFIKIANSLVLME